MKELRRLTHDDMEEFLAICREIEEVIANPDWFHAFSRETAEFFFGPDNTHVIYGCFVDGILAGVSLYDYDQVQHAWISDPCGVAPEALGAEIGGSMVRPAFRGQNIMYEINARLIEEAKKQGLSYFVATAHPDNVASNFSLKKLGLRFVTTGINPNGIIRNLYFMAL